MTGRVIAGLDGLAANIHNLRRGTMATIMLMHWREATPDEYDQAREKVGWDRDVPDGAKPGERG